MDLYESKLNLTWSCKLIIYIKITEHIGWSVFVRLTCHIELCLMIAHLNKYCHLWVRASAITHYLLTDLALVHLIGPAGQEIFYILSDTGDNYESAVAILDCPS